MCNLFSCKMHILYYKRVTDKADLLKFLILIRREWYLTHISLFILFAKL